MLAALLASTSWTLIVLLTCGLLTNSLLTSKDTVFSIAKQLSVPGHYIRAESYLPVTPTLALWRLISMATLQRIETSSLDLAHTQVFTSQSFSSKFWFQTFLHSIDPPLIKFHLGTDASYKHVTLLFLKYSNNKVWIIIL